MFHTHMPIFTWSDTLPLPTNWSDKYTATITWRKIAYWNWLFMSWWLTPWTTVNPIDFVKSNDWINFSTISFDASPSSILYNFDNVFFSKTFNSFYVWWNWYASNTSWAVAKYDWSSFSLVLWTPSHSSNWWSYIVSVWEANWKLIVFVKWTYFWVNWVLYTSTDWNTFTRTTLTQPIHDSLSWIAFVDWKYVWHSNTTFQTSTNLVNVTNLSNSFWWSSWWKIFQYGTQAVYLKAWSWVCRSTDWTTVSEFSASIPVWFKPEIVDNIYSEDFDKYIIPWASSILFTDDFSTFTEDTLDDLNLTWRTASSLASWMWKIAYFHTWGSTSIIATNDN